MSGTPKGQTLFDLCGGHAALDLVNSLDNRFRADGPNEMLASYGDVLRFLEESGLLSRQRARALSRAVAPGAAEPALRSVRELREAAAAVFYAGLDRKPPAAQDVRVLEKYFLDAGRHRELRWETGASRRPGLAWQWGRFETEPEVPLWILSEAVAELLLSDKGAYVRACNVDTCRWLFLDTSKNHTRRWCNMRVCGNRMKARRFQQARRES
jgi:predicted RNA-binding Zn ribbon-like protein